MNILNLVWMIKNVKNVRDVIAGKIDPKYMLATFDRPAIVPTINF